MEPLLKVAIIGLGSQDLSDHIPAVLKRNDLSIVAVCDPSQESQNKFIELFPSLVNKVKIFSDYRDALGEDELPIDFAIVAIPHNEYFDIAQALCSKQIPFVKEKPFARNLGEAVELLKVPHFEDYGFICSQRRYSTLYQKAKEYVSLIGDVYLFNAVYKLNIPNPHEGWRGSTEMAGGGCILDMGYHIIDQLVWWFGIPTTIFAQKSTLVTPEVEYDAEDSATIAFKYDSGLHGSVTLSRFAGDKQEEYALYGSNGSITGNKKYLVVKDKNNNILYEESISDTSTMVDSQLDFFVKRMKAGSGFSDVLEQNLMNMRFIDRCYSSC